MIQLWPYQTESVDQLLEKIKKKIQIILLVITGGGGKCHSKDTPILMHNGSIKMVQDVKVGDLVMGDDSKPRKVLSTCKGKEEMFDIIPIKGDRFGCNKSHILSVVYTSGDCYGFKKGIPANISIEKYLKLTDIAKRDIALYRTGVSFKDKKLPIDPYFLGLWIGDGTLDRLCITIPDKEVIDYLKKFANENDLFCVHKNHRNKIKCDYISFPHRNKKNRKLLNEFNKLSLLGRGGEKFIPNDFLINSKENRLQMLAGLLDTDGYMHHANYEIITKYENLKNQILFLARSLGLAAYSSKKTGTIKSINFSGEYHRITISGHTNIIPCKIKRKQAPVRKQIKNALRTGFKVESKGIGDYYGFEVDGNGLYLLGDFTVTHNSTIAGYMIKRAVDKGTPCVFIAHRKELIKQFAKRIKKEFDVDSGIIMGDEKPNPFKLLQICSIQTLNRRDLPPGKVVFVDEGHRALGPKYLKVLRQYEAAGSIIIGLTGTPFSANKKIGLNIFFQDYVNNIKCSEILALNAQDETKGVVPVKAYGAGSVSSKGMKTLGGDFRQDALMRAFDVENVYVNLIYNFELRAKDKKTIVFCSSVAHSLKVTEAFINKGYKAMHIDGDTPSKERDDAVEYFRTGQIQILVNCSIACEGLDIPNCEVVIMAVATKSKIKYLQCVWRIMRAFPGKKYGILIDMADNYERFADMGILPDGDIEVSLEPESQEVSCGVAPVKICPSCSYMNNASCKCCKDCSHEFKKTQKEIQEEEFIELKKDNKIRKWKGYKAKDWYKIEDDELEEFAKVKGYASFWVVKQKEERAAGRKMIRINNFPGPKNEYYKKVKEIGDKYYSGRALDPTEIVFNKEDKAFVIFDYVKKETDI